MVLKLDGYKTYETRLEKKFNAWYIGNIVFGGLIGIIVDPITGAMYKLKPEDVNGNLQKGTSFHTEFGHLVIKIGMDIDPNAEMIGQMEKVE